MMKAESKNWGWGKVVRFAATRIISLYAIIALACIIFLDVRELYHATMSTTLNRLIPDYTYFNKFIENGGRFVSSKADLAEHLLYYRYLEQYIPENLEVQDLLGFVYYHSGQTRAAIAAYEKAARLKPVFFWSHYNLGLLYVLNGRPAEALAQLDIALTADLQDNLNTVSMSRVYFPMLVVDDSLPLRVKDRLKRGGHDAFSLVMLILQQLGDYEGLFRKANDAIVHGLDNDGRFYYYSGLAASRINRLEEAIGMLNEGIKKFSDCGDLYLLLAHIYREQGQEERALILEKFASGISPVKKIFFPSIYDFELRIF